MLDKKFKTQERKFSSIAIKYEISEEISSMELEKSDCVSGVYTKIDTVNLSGYFAKRWFDENCHWLIEDVNDKSIAGYGIEYIIILGDDKYLRIMVSYFSKDKNEVISIKSDLLNLISDFKITPSTPPK